ncbi:outer membrane transport energization protein TonB [Anseongella ginsenosidimutans]|uniref:Outer membrane transport energization protein TonB n=1 Tax=Anseongella ginsenosidimutans TaxID=496056 RepID=A0A4R3KVC3_9SPHI|nr:energy transducer TonB [Anseongella ginsenosidimutans]QEC51685.1 TonB family protein [Anseongella ginsenosidimutans]TCS89041.1 outer membrane transport energization protein TonB [Anseongella ginsenosidimutans]
MAKIDLQDSRWCDMVFEGRNKEYGAYNLRRHYSRFATRAIIFAIVGFALCTYAPILASIIKGRNADNVVQVDLESELANVEIEQPEELPPPPPDIPPPPPAVKEVKFTPPEIVPQEEVREEDIPPPAETIEADVLLGDETREGLSKFDVPIDAPEDGEGDAIVGEVVDDKVYSFASIEKKPQFPGGNDKILSYIGKNFNYPAIARENNIQGTVYVQFTIEKDGSVSNVKAVRGQDLGGGLAEEAVRVVKDMPNWTPGEQNGQKVKVSYTLPIFARLQQ